MTDKEKIKTKKITEKVDNVVIQPTPDVTAIKVFSVLK